MNSVFISRSSLDSLLSIARNAGSAILEIYNSDDFDVEIKDDDSPLTKADKASNSVICDGLENLSEQYPIISEENKDIPYSERKSFETFWLVDPLDGTKEFIKRNGEFTVNIALIHKQRPVAGIVYVPVTDTMYYATSGDGAYIAEHGGSRRISAAEFDMDQPGLGVVCSRSHLNEATEEFIAKLKDPETVSKGSSLKFLILATGDAHLYPRIAPTMEWDTAAAQCVLEEAGGKVVEYGTYQPLLYNKEVLRNPYFLATGNVEI